MKNYSRQREAILSVLKASRSHPTAAQVYDEVRETIPNISLGTVYRNLSELAKNGDILMISVGDGTDHFDGDTSLHLHLHCRRCGAITDVPFDDTNIVSLVESKGFKPDNYVCVIYGCCRECYR